MVHDFFFSKYLDLVGPKRIELLKMKNSIITARTAGFYTERKMSHKILLFHMLSDMFEENGQNRSDILHIMLAQRLGNAVLLFILIQPFIRFAGASYTWYDNVYSGTVGDR
jgi:hypothetical protein